MRLADIVAASAGTGRKNSTSRRMGAHNDQIPGKRFISERHQFC
jgi:hypothetical protein